MHGSVGSMGFLVIYFQHFPSKVLAFSVPRIWRHVSGGVSNHIEGTSGKFEFQSFTVSINPSLTFP